MSQMAYVSIPDPVPFPKTGCGRGLFISSVAVRALLVALVSSSRGICPLNSSALNNYPRLLISFFSNLRIFLIPFVCGLNIFVFD